MSSLDVQFQYLNISNHYDSSRNYHPTVVEFNSTESLMSHNDHTRISMERFLLKRVRLPLFEQPPTPWAVRGSSLNGTELDLTSFGGGIIDSNGYGYSYMDFVISLRNALLAEDVITASDHLVLGEDGRIYFEQTGTATTVEFNSQLANDLGIFHFNDFHDPNQEWYQLTIQPDLATGAGNDAYQSFDSVAVLFPVSKLIFVSQELPVVRERLNVGTTASNESISTITDFQLVGLTNLSPINTIAFNVDTRRYHAIIGAIENKFTIRVDFQSTSGLRAPLLTASGGSSDLKLLLESHSQIV